MDEARQRQLFIALLRSTKTYTRGKFLRLALAITPYTNMATLNVSMIKKYIVESCIKVFIRCDNVCACPRSALSFFTNKMIQMKVAKSNCSGAQMRRCDPVETGEYAPQIATPET